MAFWTLLLITLGIAVTSSDALKVVYTRAYYGKDLGVARKYHAQYWQVARKSGYYTLTHWSTIFPCANYEANAYGDYMGFFSCNQWFEPYHFDYCCGKQGAHYCCPNSSLATPYKSDPDPPYAMQVWLISVIVVAVFTVILPAIGVMIYCCVVACCIAQASNRRTTPNATQGAPVVTVTSGAYPRQVQTGVYPMQQATVITYPVPEQQSTGAFAYSTTQPTGPNYSQPSDFGLAAGPSADPPPEYSSVLQKT